MHSSSLIKTPVDRQGDDVRSPECVERVWDENVDGAWAAGRASVSSLMDFLEYVQDGDVEHAEATSQQILTMEPENKLVRDLMEALKHQQLLEAQADSAAESDASEEEESSDDSDDDDSDLMSENDDEDDDRSNQPEWQDAKLAAQEK